MTTSVHREGRSLVVVETEYKTTHESKTIDFGNGWCQNVTINRDLKITTTKKWNEGAWSSQEIPAPEITTAGERLSNVAMLGGYVGVGLIGGFVIGGPAGAYVMAGVGFAYGVADIYGVGPMQGAVAISHTIWDREAGIEYTVSGEPTSNTDKEELSSSVMDVGPLFPCRPWEINWKIWELYGLYPEGKSTVVEKIINLGRIKNVSGRTPLPEPEPIPRGPWPRYGKSIPIPE